MAENATAAATAQPMVEQSPGAAPDVRTAQVFSKLAPGTAANAQASDIDMIMDIPVQLTVELGRTKIPIRHILQLDQGSVVELDGLAGAPMGVFVNGCLIAQGEVVADNDKFCIRVTDIV